MNRRQRRILETGHRRLGHVRCAIEALHQRHNVSAILRTCDAMGIQHVYLVEEERKLITGASKGVERWLDLHPHARVEQAVEAIRQDGYQLWVADFDEQASTPETIPLDVPVCLWFGVELDGVSPLARDAADGVVMVPMHGFAQSLNVSVAAALTLRPIAERARALGESALLPADEREALLDRWFEREAELGRGLVSRT